MSALSGVSATAEGIRTDYLKLLVTQLQNQNPMEPLDNSEMASQLAHLSELEELETMNKTFDKILLSQQFTQANAMIGKQVNYFVEGDDRARTGQVDSVVHTDHEVRLKVGSDVVALSDIASISG